MSADLSETRPESRNLPEGLLMAWYGDDFTGSAAVMEVLTFAGLPSVLFLEIPTPQQLAKFSGMRGIGIAGTARAQSPGWMEKHLPAIFRFLNKLNAPINHYKVCSTLDSSPDTGSIGKAIDLAQSTFNSPWVPLLIAAPSIRRFQVFGDLFAAGPGGVFRLDRHPVMACHPVTPMKEANIATHLSEQTEKQFGLISIEQMHSIKTAQEELEKQRGKPAEIIALDCVDEKTLANAGGLIWENRDRTNQSIFAVGSQGIEYALSAYWQQRGLLPTVCDPAGVEGSENIVVVSGSVSGVTHQQIDWAINQGFEGIAFDPMAAIQGEAALKKAQDNAISAALDVLARGKSPIVFTARGPDAPQVQSFQRALLDPGVDRQKAQRTIGVALGYILKGILDQTNVFRAIICGGDTSGHALQQLSIFALTALAPTIPGAALYSAHSQDPRYQKLQLALKGGQMGSPDYFEWIKKGGGAQNQTRNQT